MEPSYSFVPHYLSDGSEWTGHIPFAYDLIWVLRPSFLVELGTRCGDSFFAFCQSVADHALTTRCYAVGHWKETNHAGQPSDAQFERVEAYCSAAYPDFAHLLRADFASASREFSDESIDLLHINGLHTYEAASGVLATWFSKLRSGGVLLIHDICVRSGKDHPYIGVWKLWEELKAKHRTFEFFHAYGLGILLKNSNPEIENWLHAATETLLNAYYVRRGADLVDLTAGRQARKQRDAYAAQLQNAVDSEEELKIERDGLRRQTIESAERIAAFSSEIEKLKIACLEAKRESHSLKTSLSWRVTWPLRVLRDKGMAFADQLRHSTQPAKEYTIRATAPKSDSDSDVVRAFFDEDYYLNQTPCLVDPGTPALQHYQTVGWREGRNPHPLFDTTWYLKNHPDVAALNCEPLEHYCRYGWRKGLSPSPFFDSAWYLRAYQDVADTGMEPLTHYLQHGIREGRYPRSIDKELAELPNENFARWAAEQCTRLLSRTTEREQPSRETAIKQLSEALAAAPIEKIPDVSIVIAAHSKPDFTVPSATAVLLSSPRRSFEVIVADNGNNDETRSIFENLPRPVRYVRWERNTDLSRCLNGTAEYANGKYLVFLDDQTVVFPEWLDSLVDTFEEQRCAGLVGSKFLSANGRLQEAGGIVLSDGSRLSFGRDDAPSRSEYCYLREADYCSFRSLAVAKDFFIELGGFDERFALEHYGDTDLCFRARQRRKRVFYQPFSKLVHFDEITSCTSRVSDLNAHRQLDRSKFLDRWSGTVRDHATGGLTKRADSHSRGRILVLDATIPMPDQDCGSEITFNFLRILKRLNRRVTFVPSDLKRVDHYASRLERLGVECFCHPTFSSLRAAILHAAPEIDFAFLHRLDVARPIIDFIRSNAPRAKIIFNTIDLHFLREKREAELFGGRWRLDRAENTRREELEVIRKADATIVVSDAERALLSELAPTASVFLIGLPVECPLAENLMWNARRDIVFLGGFSHPPNSDAVLYFVREVWPILLERGYRDRFLIVGSKMPREIGLLGNDRIIPIGYVEDLKEVFSRARISVAPLRFGAGLKGKIATSLGFGVPCVTTSIGVEGSGLANQVNVLVGDNPRDFASQVLRVYNDSQLWTNLSQNGLRFFQGNYSLEAIGAKFASMMRTLESEKQTKPPERISRSNS